MLLIGFNDVYMNEFKNILPNNLRYIIDIFKWREFISNLYKMENSTKVFSNYNSIYPKYIQYILLLFDKNTLNYIFNNLLTDNEKIKNFYFIIIDMIKTSDENKELYFIYLFKLLDLSHSLLNENYEEQNLNVILDLINKNISLLLYSYQIQFILFNLIQIKELLPLMYFIYGQIIKSLENIHQIYYRNTLFSLVLNINDNKEAIKLLSLLHPLFDTNPAEYYLNQLSIAEIYKYDNYINFLKYYKWSLIKTYNSSLLYLVNFHLSSLYYYLQIFIDSNKEYTINIIEAIVSLLTIQNSSIIIDFQSKLKPLWEKIILKLSNSSVIFVYFI